MVVDDDEEIRNTIGDILEDEGHEAIKVANGREALAFLRGHAPPCLVLLDLMMPIMDGWEVLRELERDPELAKIPVVVISAGGTQLGNRKADRLLRKPLKIEHLLDAVETYC